MLHFDHDVVAGMYPLKMIHWDVGAVERAQSGESFDSAPLRYFGLLPRRRIRIGGWIRSWSFAGTGFMLVRRAVLRRMIEAFPKLATPPLTPSPCLQQPQSIRSVRLHDRPRHRTLPE